MATFSAEWVEGEPGGCRKWNNCPGRHPDHPARAVWRARRCAARGRNRRQRGCGSGSGGSNWRRAAGTGAGAAAVPASATAPTRRAAGTSPGTVRARRPRRRAAGIGAAAARCTCGPDARNSPLPSVPVTKILAIGPLEASLTPEQRKTVVPKEYRTLSDSTRPARSTSGTCGQTARASFSCSILERDEYGSEAAVAMEGS
jgi:hypothetical protein